MGHAGTLDPFASGLLLVLVGPRHPLPALLHGAAQGYRARARFGAVSDTGDPTAGRDRRPAVTRTIGGALPRLTGEIEQRVPLASAVKVGGERLYRKARRGEEFETPVRQVRVDRSS